MICAPHNMTCEECPGTVAHELVESLLLLLTLGLDLLLHVLKQDDDPPDRVLRFAQAESSHRAPAAGEQKRQRKESHLALAPRSVLTAKSQQTLVSRHTYTSEDRAGCIWN